MKKILRLTEGEFIKFINQIVLEANFVNQEMVDRILDKINQSGYDSLNDEEKEILKNPNSPISTEVEDGGENCVKDLVKLLFLNGLVEPENLNIYDEYIEIHGFNDVDLDYFNGEDYVRLYCIFDEGRKVYMDFEDYDDEGDEDLREEVKLHLKNEWEKILPNTEFLTDDGMSDI